MRLRTCSLSCSKTRKCRKPSVLCKCRLSCWKSNIPGKWPLSEHDESKWRPCTDCLECNSMSLSTGAFRSSTSPPPPSTSKPAIDYEAIEARLLASVLEHETTIARLQHELHEHSDAMQRTSDTTSRHCAELHAASATHQLELDALRRAHATELAALNQRQSQFH